MVNKGKPAPGGKWGNYTPTEHARGSKVFSLPLKLTGGGGVLKYDLHSFGDVMGLVERCSLF